jgi:metal-sulfur cluster biosynthetic enzyme
VSSRRSEALAALNEIVDPCSAAQAVPLGLVDMGLVDRLDTHAGCVRVSFVPTFPGCIYIGLFEAEIRRRLLALPWCREVQVEIVDGAVLWDEERMSPRGQAALAESRARLRRRLREAGGSSAGVAR